MQLSSIKPDSSPELNFLKEVYLLNFLKEVYLLNLLNLLNFY